MPASCAVARCPEAAKQVSDWPGLVMLGLVALVIGSWLIGWYRTRNSLWIDPAHPLMVEATRKARASIDSLRALHASHPDDALVKFRFRTSRHSVEWLWGPLRMLNANSFTAAIMTPARFDDEPLPDEVTLPLDDLCDWHVQLPDGSIRGSFTRRAEIRLRTQANKSLPETLEKMRGRFAND